MKSLLTTCSKSLLPLLIGGLAVCGCSDSGGGGGSKSSAGGGQLNVQVTDAPLRDLSKVTLAEITVERVLIHAAQISSSTTAAATTGSMAAGGNANANGNGNASTVNANANANAATNAKGLNPNALANAQQGQGQQGQQGQQAQGQGQGQQGQAAAGVNGNGNGNGNANGGNGNGNGNGNGSGGNGQEITIFDAATSGGAKVFNLLDLRGGIMAELVNANLPAGTYTHIRLELSDAQLVVDGTTYSLGNGMLTIPSGATAGLKIPFRGAHAIDIKDGQTTQTLLDFDLSRSFNVIGPPTKPNSITMSPVIRGANLAASGNVAGLVTSDNGTPNDTADDAPLANAIVTVTEANPANGQQPATVTTFTDSNGVYYVPGLAGGDWDVLFEDAAHDSLAQAAQTVAAGSQTTLDVTLTKK